MTHLVPESVYLLWLAEHFCLLVFNNFLIHCNLLKEVFYLKQAYFMTQTRWLIFHRQLLLMVYKACIYLPALKMQLSYFFLEFLIMFVKLDYLLLILCAASLYFSFYLVELSQLYSFQGNLLLQVLYLLLFRVYKFQNIFILLFQLLDLALQLVDMLLKLLYFTLLCLWKNFILLR